MSALGYTLRREFKRLHFDCFSDVDQFGNQVRIIQCEKPEVLKALFSAMKDPNDPVYALLDQLDTQSL